MSVSEKIQIGKEKDRKMGKIGVVKNLLEVGFPTHVIYQVTGLQDLKINSMLKKA
ncbi:hypothetical protein QUS22_01650 [Wolbachia pipientis]|nr:hypothetical protein [Wolbachia pipientis]